ncbi:unnamed protein product [Hyaloperonospora brassicae]|uniref:Uncharacterized protein n=1 Tax=Hyaloperonospora brassicae TaxID=162125 RepID=A0AAV0TB36_HYABA|nr:unnamed protein product [Hyaloperonospora brassicae]
MSRRRSSIGTWLIDVVAGGGAASLKFEDTQGSFKFRSRVDATFCPTLRDVSQCVPYNGSWWQALDTNGNHSCRANCVARVEDTSDVKCGFTGADERCENIAVHDAAGSIRDVLG